MDKLSTLVVMVAQDPRGGGTVMCVPSFPFFFLFVFCHMDLWAEYDTKKFLCVMKGRRCYNYDTMTLMVISDISGTSGYVQAVVVFSASRSGLPNQKMTGLNWTVTKNDRTSSLVTANFALEKLQSI
jgi:hypothetical protein